jgi:hypothetical protein
MFVPIQILAVVLLTTGQGPAAKQPSTIDTDVATIRTMSVVSDGHDGDAGVTPESVYAFRRLIHAPNAGSRFAQLLQEATPAGQLYALCGLYFTDADAFRSAVPAFERSEQEVQHQQGCILSTDTVADMIHSAYRPVISLEPGQAPEAWFKRHPESRNGGFHVDIAGGGFCHLINGTLWPDEGPPSN